MLRAMWRKLLRAMGCLSYLGMLGVLFALVAYLAFSQFVRRGVTPTPELFGASEEDAAAYLTDAGLRIAWSEEDNRYDERVPEGHVLLQKPGAGTLVKRGSSVLVILSRGPQLLEVPDVTGNALQAAQVTLTAAGLGVGRTFNVYTARGAGGAVVAQSPESGERVERSATVDLFLAGENAGQTFVMPDLVNRGYAEVRRFFETRGFRIGRVSYESYEGVAPGTVLSQFPQAGYPLRRGEVIALVVVASPPGSADAANADTGSGEPAP